MAVNTIMKEKPITTSILRSKVIPLQQAVGRYHLASCLFGAGFFNISQLITNPGIWPGFVGILRPAKTGLLVVLYQAICSHNSLTHSTVVAGDDHLGCCQALVKRSAV